jgi:hypothetical protein
MLSEAKDLSRWAARCFAALSMTLPALVVNLHYRPWWLLRYPDEKVKKHHTFKYTSCERK